MTEDFEPITTSLDDLPDAGPVQGKSNKTVAIIVAVLLVLCCCCVGVVLLFYFVLGDMILQALDIQVWLPALQALV